MFSNASTNKYNMNPYVWKAYLIKHIYIETFIKENITSKNENMVYFHPNQLYVSISNILTIYLMNGKVNFIGSSKNSKPNNTS